MKQHLLHDLKDDTSMADPDLRFLGEQIRRIQADLRNVRAEQIRLESEQAQLREVVENEFAAVQAQFQQVHRTMGANLEVLLTAIRGKTE